MISPKIQDIIIGLNHQIQVIIPLRSDGYVHRVVNKKTGELEIAATVRAEELHAKNFVQHAWAPAREDLLKLNLSLRREYLRDPALTDDELAILTALYSAIGDARPFPKPKGPGANGIPPTPENMPNYDEGYCHNVSKETGEAMMLACLAAQELVNAQNAAKQEIAVA